MFNYHEYLRYSKIITSHNPPRIISKKDHVITIYYWTHLALITSQLQETAIGVWIGLFKENPGDPTFKWVDSSQFDFENWADNEPNSDEVCYFAPLPDIRAFC